MIKRSLIQILLLVFTFLPAFGQGTDSLGVKQRNDSSRKSFRLFEDDKPLEISLEFNLTSYMRSKSNENYLNAVMVFNPGTSDSLRTKVKLRTRGIFRRQNCNYSPIELNFKGNHLPYSDLKSISKLKLVTQCQSGAINENYLVREYLVYKLFNAMTDTSFRVRLLAVNYIDSEKKRKTVRQAGFFIEPVEMLAERTNTVQVKSKMLNQRSMIPYIMDRVAIFNYMIGNYDWSVPGLHNIRVLKSKLLVSDPRGIAVPYDFDWSGLVNADDAIPADNVGIPTVRDRLFLGMCRSREVYIQELKQFAGKKPEFYKIINEFKLISKRDKEEIIGFMDSFFDKLSGKRDLSSLFFETCKIIKP